MNGIGNNLKRFRILKGLSLKDAGESMNMSSTAIIKYENGEIKPNSSKLIEFANAYDVKIIDILKSYSAPTMTFKSFRKKQRLVGKNYEALKNEIRIEVSKYLEVLELNNQLNNIYELPYYTCSDIEDIEKCAMNFRRDIIKIPNIYPIPDLTNFLENLGIYIIYIKNKNNLFSDFDGLTEIVNGIPFIVLLDNQKDGARQRFTIAHELGHLILDGDVLNKDEEKMCHRFASALLMPKEAMVKEFGSSRTFVNWLELEAIQAEYKVSLPAIAYRLKDLEIISERYYKTLTIYINKIIKSNNYNPVVPEKSYQFEKTVCKLETSNIITIQKAAELLGMTSIEYNFKYNNN